MKKGKTRASVPTFQKKLNYMGPEHPPHFTLRDKNIVMRGLLPEIPFDASEQQIREEIRYVIRSCSEYDVSMCSVSDLDMNGKTRICAEFQRWYELTGKAVKNLAGSGSVYVRMTLDLFLTSLSETSDDDDVMSTARQPTLPMRQTHFAIQSTGAPLSSLSLSRLKGHLRLLHL